MRICGGMEDFGRGVSRLRLRICGEMEDFEKGISRLRLRICGGMERRTLEEGSTRKVRKISYLN